MANKKDLNDGGQAIASLRVRDYFAACALQGLIASNDEKAGDRIEELPSYAYAIADQMLKEREK